MKVMPVIDFDSVQNLRLSGSRNPFVNHSVGDLPKIKIKFASKNVYNTQNQTPKTAFKSNSLNIFETQMSDV